MSQFVADFEAYIPAEFNEEDVWQSRCSRHDG